MFEYECMSTCLWHDTVPIKFHIEYFTCEYLCDRSLAGGAMFITSVILATVIFVTRKGTSNVSEYMRFPHDI